MFAFMLTAIRASDGAKVIGEFTNKDPAATYRCEKCENPVIHHRSEARLRVGHFAHKAGASFCPNDGETLEHVQTKLDIYEYIRKGWGDKLRVVEPEAWICNRTIRPDVYVETRKGSRIAIEVQASALTVDEIIRRTRKYHTEGVHVLWVLPFQFRRFFERYYEMAWRNGYSIEHFDDHWIRKDKVKLMSYEQFIYWAYLKKLILWDLEHKHSDGFVVIELSRHVGESSSYFTSGGEEHYHEGRKSKTFKVVDRVVGNVRFDQLRTHVFHDDFIMKSVSYSIPARHIMNFDPTKWKGLTTVAFPPLRQRHNSE